MVTGENLRSGQNAAGDGIIRRMLVLSFDILATQSPEARYRLAGAGKLYKVREDIVIESSGSIACA